MNYKGAYSADASYNVGDVVVYTDNIAYIMTKAEAVTPHEKRCWARLDQPFQEIVLMFHSMLSGLGESKALADAMLFDAKTIILASSTEASEKRYAVTVDDEDGLVATEIEEAEEGEG